MQFALKDAAQRLLDEAKLASPLNPCPSWGNLTISAPKSIAWEGRLGCVVSAKCVQQLIKQITSVPHCNANVPLQVFCTTLGMCLGMPCDCIVACTSSLKWLQTETIVNPGSRKAIPDSLTEQGSVRNFSKPTSSSWAICWLTTQQDTRGRAQLYPRKFSGQYASGNVSCSSK